MSVPQKNEEIAPPDFTTAELQAMHRWCLRYRDRVRCGDNPTAEQDARFMAYSAIGYQEGGL